MKDQEKSFDRSNNDIRCKLAGTDRTEKNPILKWKGKNPKLYWKGF